MSFTVRPASPDDAPVFHAVMMAAGMDPRSSWSRTRVEDVAWSLAQGGGFLAWNGGEPVGCVGWRPDGPQTLTLNKLATRPEARGRGIGVALVHAVEEVAARDGYARVLLAVSQYNLAVIPFYERLGYRVDEGAVYAHANPASPPPVVLVKPIFSPARGEGASERQSRPIPTEDAKP